MYDVIKIIFLGAVQELKIKNVIKKGWQILENSQVLNIFFTLRGWPVRPPHSSNPSKFANWSQILKVWILPETSYYTMYIIHYESVLDTTQIDVLAVASITHECYLMWNLILLYRQIINVSGMMNWMKPMMRL